MCSSIEMQTHAGLTMDYLYWLVLIAQAVFREEPGQIGTQTNSQMQLNALPCHDYHRHRLLKLFKIY